jgi:hypothetical protein
LCTKPSLIEGFFVSAVYTYCFRGYDCL